MGSVASPSSRHFLRDALVMVRVAMRSRWPDSTNRFASRHVLEDKRTKEWTDSDRSQEKDHVAG